MDICVTRFTACWSMRTVSGSRKSPSGGIHPLFLAFVLRKGYSGVLRANEGGLVDFQET
jgi:hypothetical protein